MEDKQREPTDFMEAICAETWKELYRFIYYKVQNKEEAQDITQETYAKAISYLRRKENNIIDYGSYLRAIAVNIIRDQWRAKSRKGDWIDIDEISTEEVATGDFSDYINERTLIEETLSKLTTEQQTVIKLRLLKGYTVAETAKLMNKKQGTIRVMQYRAIKALSELLKDER